MSVTGIYHQAWKAKLMLAASSTWQTICGVDNATDALDYIAIYYGEDADYTYPRAIIDDTSQGGAKTHRLVGLSTWVMEATVVVTFAIEIPASAGATNIEEEGNWFASQIGQIVNEIELLSTSRTLVGSGEYPLQLMQSAPIEGPDRIAAEERAADEPEAGVSTLPLWTETIEFTVVP